jgi:hypothetical protein
MSFNKVFKTITMCAAVGLVALPLIAKAADTEIEAAVTFLTTITLGNEQDMDFGTVEFSAQPTGASDFVTLGTDGSRNCESAFSCPATNGTPGSVEITAGSNGQVVQVQCSASALLASNDGSVTIGIDAIQVDDLDNAGAFSTGNCSGIGNSAMTYELGSGTDTLVFGGRISGAFLTGTLTDGVYSTENPNGENIQIEVIYN